MSAKTRQKLYDYVIKDGIISGVTENGANIRRRIYYHEFAVVETVDFIFDLVDEKAPIEDVIPPPERSYEEFLKGEKIESDTAQQVE